MRKKQRFSRPRRPVPFRSTPTSAQPTDASAPVSRWRIALEASAWFRVLVNLWATHGDKLPALWEAACEVVTHLL